LTCDAVGCEAPTDIVVEAIVRVEKEKGIFEDVKAKVNFCKAHHDEQIELQKKSTHPYKEFKN